MPEGSNPFSFKEGDILKDTVIAWVRHGETEWNRLRKLQGQRDIPLNDTGKSKRMPLPFAWPRSVGMRSIAATCRGRWRQRPGSQTGPACSCKRRTREFGNGIWIRGRS